MKTINIFFISLLFCFVIISCKTKDVIPEETCRVSIIDRGNGNKHIYTYDANGKVATMTREFDGSGSGNISKYLYSFTYDNAGLLSKSTWTLDGKPDGSETYTYTNGKISKVNYLYADGSKGVNNIKYDAAGMITEFTYDTGDPANDAIQYFGYDSNGIQVKHGYKGFDGTIFFESVAKPVGVAKSPEQLLVKNGLPHDVLTGYSWATTTGNVGTTFESFVPDVKGKLASVGTGKVTNIKVDTKGYISEDTFVDEANKSYTSRFSLINCN